MLRLKDTRHQNTASFLNSAIDIAEYYGFTSLDEASHAPRAKEEPSVVKPSEKQRIPTVSECESDISFARRDERALVATAKRCLSCARNAGTKLLWKHSLGSRSERSSIPASTLELHVVGASGAIAEALLIVVADAVAAEAGIAKRILSINSIGSSDSSNRFVRDVGVYLRKHIDSISPTLRPRIAEDPLGTLVQLIERGHPATSRAPQSMEYLTEEERRKFWELLEYLEVFGLPYELNPQILGSRECWAHSLFDISVMDEETGTRISLAYGGRYDPLAARFAPSPAAMISINCEIRGSTRIRREARAAPAIYFAHLGPDARRRTLGVLEMLRGAEIPVYQSLMYERIGEQMAEARRYAVPYVLIMGHKEAMEGTILVREVATNSQDAIPLPELTNYLKRHRVAVAV
ncbi:MAG: His/Gly/Thr/Pro-type tRNA ligase C-terminal domain-containing protein [bacterium]|nr:His/Gly/Thr/Pro-type tRNA ligase C-terminal domain-containing protein [bacterium]